MSNNGVGRRLLSAAGSSQEEVDDDSGNGEDGGGSAGIIWSMFYSACVLLSIIVCEYSFIWYSKEVEI